MTYDAGEIFSEPRSEFQVQLEKHPIDIKEVVTERYLSRDFVARARMEFVVRWRDDGQRMKFSERERAEQRKHTEENIRAEINAAFYAPARSKVYELKRALASSGALLDPYATECLNALLETLEY